MMFYFVFWTISFGPIGWMLITELFPTKIRGNAMAVGIFSNWVGNLLTTVTFSSFLSALGLLGVFLLYSAMGLVSLVLIFFCVPETKGRSIEQMQAAFETLPGKCKGVNPEEEKTV